MMYTSVKARVEYCREQGMLAGVVASEEPGGLPNSVGHQAPSSGLAATFSPEAGEKGQGSPQSERTSTVSLKLAA